MPKKVKPPSKVKPLELFFVGSIVFFVLALGLAGFLFFNGNNTVSTKNVDVQVTGPTEVGAGSTLSLQVVVTDRNAVPMQLTDLVVEFPQGTRSADDVSQDLPRIRESLGTIDPGKSVNRTVRAVLYGTQGTDFTIKASAEYRVPSSNAVFVSESDYALRINQSPAAISVDSVTEAVSGQQVTFTTSVSSNAPDVLKNMLLSATYPPGFTFISSNPTPANGTNTWELGDIEPGGVRKISITGVFSGEDGESRVMHFVSGNKQDGSDDQIAAPLASADLSLTVAKPFISTNLTLDGDTSSTHVISRGEDVAGSISWTNNLPVKVENLSITVSLNGQVLDKLKVKTQNGFYNSNSSSILWDKSTDPDFAEVAPGASGTESFTFAALPGTAGVFKNPDINLSVSVQADRASETGVPEQVQASANAKAVVNTSLAFGASATVNNGPNPPKVGTATTFMVTWVANNSGNSIANASVSGVLPSYMTYVSGGSGVTYDSTSRTVTWNIGDMPSGSALSGLFQVILTPSTSQIQSAPILVKGQQFSAIDRFTQATLQQTAGDLTTQSVSSSNGGAVIP